MFQNLKTHHKILLLTLIFVAVSLVELQFHKFNLSVQNVFSNCMIAFLECFVLMLIGFFYFQTFKFHRIWDVYYRKKSFETQKFFHVLGVPIFQFILTNSFMRYANPRVYLKGRKRDYIRTLHEETKQSETSHLLVILVTMPVQMDYFITENMFSFWTLTLCSFFFNVYPILLQRMNRFLLEVRFVNVLKDFKS